VQTLGSAERREIVDYVSGAGFAMKPIPGAESGGWGTKFNRWIVGYLQGLHDRDDATKMLQEFDGIGKVRAKALINAGNDTNIERIRNGDTGFLKDIPESFWNELRLRAVREIGASVDEPVTGDIKRLIRLPTSLHGGSSLRVAPLTLENIEVFDPLKDAVVFADVEIISKISVAAESPASCDLLGNHFEIEEGVNTVPEYAGVYLMCRGAVEYVKRL
jgi:DNA primase small subunit